MIIKSMSRKDRCTHQLIQYIFRDSENLTVMQNMNCRIDPVDIANELHDNSKLLPARKNGTVYFHEILSFAKEDHQKLSAAILYDISRTYMYMRGENHKGIARIHTDKDHLHIHFVFSSNEVGSNKRRRLSKAEFSRLKQSMSLYQQRKYPELTHSYKHRQEKRIERGRNNYLSHEHTRERMR